MVRWIGNELQNLSMYYGTGTVEEFFDEMEFTVEERNEIPAMDVVLCGTPAHW